MMQEKFGFGFALRGLLSGHRLRRIGWNPKCYLAFDRGVIEIDNGWCVDRWEPLQADILADDWQIYQEKGKE